MNKEYWKFLKKYIFSQKKDFLLACFVTILKSTAMICQPLAYKSMIDKALPRKDLQLFLISLGIMMGCYFLSIFFNIARDYVMARISEKVCFDLRQQLNEKISRLEYSFFDTHGVSDIISKYSKEVDVIQNNCGYMILEFAGNVVTFIMAFVMIAVLEWRLVPVIIVVFACFFFSNRYFGEKVRKYAEESMECNNQSTAVIAENYTNVVVTKLYSIYNRVNEKFREKYQKQFDTQIKLELSYSININGSAFWIFLLNGFIWLIGGFQICNNLMTLGTVVALADYQNILISPFNFFCKFNNGYQETQIAMQRIAEVMDYPEEEGIFQIEETKDYIKTITFSNMDFQYQNREEVLKNVNLTMKQGNVYAFVGESGCGKSTIAKLLVGLYKPVSGQITMNDKNIEDMTIGTLREKVGYVPQDSLFYEDSILNNILFGKEKDMAEVEEYGRQIDIYQDIMKMPEGWNTVLNSGTTNISGGQKKRLDLLRIFLQEKDVIIFDESTASLDVDRRALLFDYVKKIRNHKIVIFITHNMEECNQFDTIFTIKNKQISEVSKQDIESLYGAE